jgi:two-component SAPR family response regulator
MISTAVMAPVLRLRTEPVLAISPHRGRRRPSDAYSSSDAAHTYLDEHRPDFAVLDINLGDQTSFGIADRLHDLGVPFLFASGYGEQAKLPDEHRARTVVQKPFTTHNLARAAGELLGLPFE